MITIQYFVCSAFVIYVIGSWIVSSFNLSRAGSKSQIEAQDRQFFDGQSPFSQLIESDDLLNTISQSGDSATDSNTETDPSTLNLGLNCPGICSTLLQARATCQNFNFSQCEVRRCSEDDSNGWFAQIQSIRQLGFQGGSFMCANKAPTPSPSVCVSPSPSASATASVSASSTPSPNVTPSASAAATVSPSPSQSRSLGGGGETGPPGAAAAPPSSTATATPSVIISASPSPSITASTIPSSAVPSTSPSASASQSASASPSSSPSVSASESASVSPSPSSSASPSVSAPPSPSQAPICNLIVRRIPPFIRIRCRCPDPMGNSVRTFVTVPNRNLRRCVSDCLKTDSNLVEECEVTAAQNGPTDRFLDFRSVVQDVNSGPIVSCCENTCGGNFRVNQNNEYVCRLGSGGGGGGGGCGCGGP